MRANCQANNVTQEGNGHKELLQQKQNQNGQLQVDKTCHHTCQDQVCCFLYLKLIESNDTISVNE